MIHCVKLTPKSLRGRNKFNEAGRPEHWTVLKECDYVGFSDRSGPWLHVTPANGMTDKDRWVSMTDDPDFNVEVVR